MQNARVVIGAPLPNGRAKLATCVSVSNARLSPASGVHKRIVARNWTMAQVNIRRLGNGAEGATGIIAVIVPATLAFPPACRRRFSRFVHVKCALEKRAVSSFPNAKDTTHARIP